MIKKIIKKSLKNKYLLDIKKHKITSLKDINHEDAFKHINSLFQHQQLFDKSPIKQLDNYEYDLSLIVPVYNSQDYLKQCLSSLINQNTNYNYEIIIIDDGSKDNSYQIIKEFNDPKLKIFKQDNQGISSTRNKGLSLALGRYVGFIDNDDYVTDNYVQSLLETAYKYNADYVKSGHDIILNDKTIQEVTYPFEIIDKIQDDKLFKYDGYIWSGIQSRYLWQDFAFPEKYWYEDIITRLYLYQKARILVNLDKIIYHKRAHEKNASKIIWNNSSYNCLDQLQLVLFLDELRNKQNIAYTDLTYKYELQELGPMLYRRTINLSEQERKDMFIVAANYINNKNNISIDSQDIISYYTQIAFNNYDFDLWQLIGKYDRY